MGCNLQFLGMNIKLCEATAHVNIDLSEILKDIHGSCDNPCGMNLFHNDDSSPLLDKVQAARFHSMVAKLLYVAKRTRPDILLPVNFLCTRVKQPNEVDLNKLNRVLKYLNATKDMILELGMSVNEDDTIDLLSYIDASYSVHEDCKSHSGAIFSLGKGTFLPCSTKQGCVSKSSTEAELIAYTDYIGEAMSLKNICQDITGRKVNLIILQDNNSVISIIKNGKLAGKSKHASKHVRNRVA